MDSVTTSADSRVAPVGLTARRCLRNGEEHPTAHVRRTTTGSGSSRGPNFVLSADRYMDVHVPSVFTDKEGSTAHPVNTVPDHSDSTCLTNTTMVLTSTFFPGRSTTPAATTLHSSQAATVMDIPSRSKTTVSTSVEAIQSALIQRAFSSVVVGVHRILHRSSTQSVYDSK